MKDLCTEYYQTQINGKISWIHRVGGIILLIKFSPCQNPNDIFFIYVDSQKN
jgi:hypothetical protein